MAFLKETSASITTTSVTAARLQLGLSQRKLAAKAKVSPQTISRVERGSMTNITLEKALRIAWALEKKVEDLWKVDWRQG